MQPGTWPVDNVAVRLKRSYVTSTFTWITITDVAQGTVTFTQVDANAVGSFSGTLQFPDGGTSSIAGSWNTAVCY